VVDINHRDKFVRAKIIYYGPAAGGKTTNLQVLHHRAHPDRKLELVSVNTAQDRTILFDLLPLKTPAFRSYELRFQVIAVPGQRLYAATRKMLLKGVDCVVFVANSATDRWTENLESLKEMTNYLLENGLEPGSIPIVFQYNKRDLPYTTDVKVMDRALNARGSESFTAVGTREEGVLETFAAVLRRTMMELSSRYRIGETLRDPRRAMEWTEKTMREAFSMDGPPPADREPPEPPPTTVVRVSSPSTLAPGAGPAAASGAAHPKDPKAVEALVESYAEAASDLAGAMAALREERDDVKRRLEDLYGVTEVAGKLLAGEKAEPLLGRFLERISKGLGTSTASLTLQRPDGRLESVILYGLVAEPVHACLSPGGRPLASALLESGKPYLQTYDQAGPLSEAIDRAGEGCVGLAVIPMKTAGRPVGLLSFYLGQESAIPNRQTMEHLQQVAWGLGMALEVATGALVTHQLEKSLQSSFAGEAAEQALRASASAVSELAVVAARQRSRSDVPSWLASDIETIERALSVIDKNRRSVSDIASARFPDPAPTPLAPIFEDMKAELEGPLSAAGIRFDMEVKPDLPPVLANSVLLRAALRRVVESARSSFDGLPHSGVIKVFAQPAGRAVRISVFDNSALLKEQGGPYVRWPIERRVQAVSYALARAVIEQYQGQWAAETREGKGTIVFILLPAAE